MLSFPWADQGYQVCLIDRISFLNILKNTLTVELLFERLHKVRTYVRPDVSVKVVVSNVPTSEARAHSLVCLSVLWLWANSSSSSSSSI